MNYEIPLELRCIAVTTMATQQGGVIQVLKAYRATIMWRDIVSIEEAVFNHQVPPINEECCTIATYRTTYTVKGEFETLAADWIAYKEWLNKSKPNFNLNAN